MHIVASAVSSAWAVDPKIQFSETIMYTPECRGERNSLENEKEFDKYKLLM